MNLIKIIKNYIRGFEYGSNTDMAPGYTIQLIQIESRINKDLSMLIFFLFFAIFWLGIENYMDIVQYIIELLRRRRN